MAADVQVYKYEPGFIHAKCYLTDEGDTPAADLHAGESLRSDAVN